MPSVPPFSRSEKIEDYAAGCRPVVWKEARIRAADGTKLTLAVGEIPAIVGNPVARTEQAGGRKKKRVVVVYFQGNGASIPPRLPSLSPILRTLHDPRSPTSYAIVALSYRGFWSSSGRASEKGIKIDAIAALSWAAETFSSNINEGEEVKFVLWGQSLGAGVAADAAAAMSRMATRKGNREIRIDGLLLETPFVSVKDMLLELYPQKWLPYRYLGPFLRNHWDTREALRQLAETYESEIRPGGGKAVDVPKILILQAGKDELVPASQGVELEACAREVGLDVSRLEVKGALHNEVALRASGKAAIAKFLTDIGDSGGNIGDG